MKYYFIIFLTFIASLSLAQQVECLPNENGRQVAERIKPEKTTLLSNVLETICNAKPCVVVFYQQKYKLPLENDPDQQDYERIIGKLFLKTDSMHYTGYLIDNFESDGGDPNIESVFFANADRGKKTELIIIVSWPQRHAEVNGTLYETFIYDESHVNDTGKLNYLKDVSKKLSGGCDCQWSDGKTKKAKFKTEAAIRSRLKSLGYR